VLSPLRLFNLAAGRYDLNRRLVSTFRSSTGCNQTEKKLYQVYESKKAGIHFIAPISLNLSLFKYRKMKGVPIGPR
jgi:hypothetical protein